MLTRFFKPILPSYLSKKSPVSFHTLVSDFKAGCIITVSGNGRSDSQNKADLLDAIPSYLHLKNCLLLVVDPTVIGSRDTKNIRHLLCPFTHISACIIQPSKESMNIRESSLISMVRDAKASSYVVSDAKLGGELGVVKNQDYKTKSSFQKLGTVNAVINKMPPGGFQERYFVMIQIDAFSNKSEEVYIKEQELAVQQFKHEQPEYDRLKMACVHAVLKTYGHLDEKAYYGSSPQKTAIIVMKELLKDEAQLSDAFEKASSESGLRRTEIELGQLFEQKKDVKDKQKNESAPVVKL
jgi:hypothetical protein